MKKITIVNENNEVTSSVDIEEAVEKKLIRKIVRIFLLDSEGRIFLQKRTSNMKFYPDRWDQSAGGHVDEGEDSLTAAKRELNEELGIEVPEMEKVEEPFYMEENTSQGVIKSFNNIYRAYYSGQEMDFQEKEVVRGKWFKPEKIDEMISDEPEIFSEGFVKTWHRYKDSILDFK